MKNIAFVFLGLFLSGCLVPKPPQEKLFSSIENKESLFEIWTIKSIKEIPSPRNVIYMAADANIQNLFSQKMPKKNGRPIHLEDLVWWEHAPVLVNGYKKIIRIPAEKVRYKNVMAAIEYAESLREPYDIFILTHGFPNHLTSGLNYFLSRNELQKLEGKLKNLNLVFMQSCFSSTLSELWMQAGAQSIISFEGFNNNFFYFSIFLKSYVKDPKSVKAIFRETTQNVKLLIYQNILYSKIIHAFGYDIDSYLANLSLPVFM